MSSFLEYATTIDSLDKTPVSMVGVFPRGYVSILAGEPGCGKTWFVLSVSRAIADGIHGLGIPDGGRYNVGKVMLFAGETGCNLLADRIDKLGGVKNQSNFAILSSHQLQLQNIDCNLHSPAGIANIADTVKEYKPDIVFFDTLISFIGDGKDESSQSDMTSAIRSLTLVAAMNKSAIVLVHHFRKRKIANKNSERDQNEVIGSSTFIRLAAQVVSVEKGQNGCRLVKCMKSWWEQFNPFMFKIVNSAHGVRIADDYNFDESGSHSVVAAVERAVKYLRTLKSPFTLDSALLHTEIGRNTMIEAIRRMKEAGEIEAKTDDAHHKPIQYSIKLTNSDE